MPRKIEAKDFVGKTVKSVDASAVNVVTVFFTDGTKLAMEVTTVVVTPFGAINGIYTDGIEAADG